MNPLNAATAVFLFLLTLLEIALLNTRRPSGFVVAAVFVLASFCAANVYVGLAP